MVDKKDRAAARIEMTSQQPDSTDPAYLAWKKAKIRAAIKAADEKPDDVVTQEGMWKMFGLDH